jgi:hypothetical protein
LERKVKIPMPPDGKMVEGFEVPVMESTERWTEIKLEDGSVLRVKPSVIAAIRVTDQYDQDGNPMYALKATNTMMVVDAQERLKRPLVDATKKTN